ncbi:MAG: hypothetical protein GF363_01215 [Chitinivibrionales bacterium]|nr:hypothetical protein [Chitinivibrionales bacterium]
MRPTKVETYSGYKADEYPKRFWVGDRELEVMDVEDRWFDPAFSYFRVFTNDAGRYILRRQIESDCWEYARIH